MAVSRFISIFVVVLARVKYFDCSLTGPPVALNGDPGFDIGILLLTNSSELSDSRNIRPAIEVAFADALGNFSVNFTAWYRLYSNSCSNIQTWFAVASGVDLLLNNNVDLRPDSPNFGYAMNPVIGNMVLGPACTPDYEAFTMATQRIMTLLVTGQAEETYSTQNKNFTIRTGYNVYDIW